MKTAIIAIVIICAILHITIAKERILNALRACNFPNSNAQERNECLKKCLALLIEVNENASTPIMGLHIQEPLLLDGFPFIQQSEGLDLAAEFSDVKLFGLSKFAVLSTLLDYENRKIKLSTETPSIIMEGNYLLNGNFLLLPIKGNGDFWITASNLSLTFDMEIIANKKNNQYLAIQNVAANLKLGKTEMHFNNLFKDDPVLDETMHHFLNTNYELIIEQIAPTLNFKVATILQDLFNEVFNYIPRNIMYPNGKLL